MIQHFHEHSLSWKVDFKITIYEQWTSHFEKNREKNEEFLSERQGCFLPINWEQWYKYCCDINMEFRSGSFQIFGFKYLEVRLEPGFNMNLNHIHGQGTFIIITSISNIIVIAFSIIKGNQPPGQFPIWIWQNYPQHNTWWLEPLLAIISNLAINFPKFLVNYACKINAKEIFFFRYKMIIHKLFLVLLMLGPNWSFLRFTN